MFLKEHNISVRLPQEKTIDTGIVFVQNDKDVYKLNIRVFDGVYEIDYSQVESATITFSKADGAVVQGDMQKEADQLTYVLGTNEIAAPGKLIATIQLLGANERLTTARFVFNVEKDLITEDAVKSTSEFPVLQRLKEELEAIDVVDLTNQFNAHKADYEQHLINGTHENVSITNTNDATSATSAPLKSAGGLAVAKRAFIGDKTKIKDAYIDSFTVDIPPNSTTRLRVRHDGTYACFDMNIGIRVPMGGSGQLRIAVAGDLFAISTFNVAELARWQLGEVTISDVTKQPGYFEFTVSNTSTTNAGKLYCTVFGASDGSGANIAII